MPFESEAQRRWMYANEPEMAKRWQKHTPKGKKLPERVTDKEAAYRQKLWGGAIAELAKRLGKPSRSSFRESRPSAIRAMTTEKGLSAKTAMVAEVFGIKTAKHEIAKGPASAAEWLASLAKRPNVAEQAAKLEKVKKLPKARKPRKSKKAPSLSMILGRPPSGHGTAAFVSGD